MRFFKVCVFIAFSWPISFCAFGQTDARQSVDYFNAKDSTGQFSLPGINKPLLNWKLSFSSFIFMPKLETDLNVNLSLGVELDIQTTKVISVKTGMNFFAISQTYHFNDTFWMGENSSGSRIFRTHFWTKIEAYGIEIPLQLSYQARLLGRKLYLSLGTSSYISSKEAYEQKLGYEQSGVPDRVSFSKNETERSFEFMNYFGSGNVSVGRSYSLSENIHFELELFYKFPLSDMSNIFRRVEFKEYESYGFAIKYLLNN